MAERKELLAMAKLLGREDTCLQNKTDLELLKIIVAQVESNKDPLNLLDFEDSLAFPQATRDKIQLIGAGHLWSQLDSFNDQMRQDYTCRRQMLLRRLDCTVESFKWKGSTTSSSNSASGLGAAGDGSDSTTKTLNDQIHECYEKARIRLKEEPQVTLAHLLAARETGCDKLLNGVVSTNNVDCKITYRASNSSEVVNLKQVIIPHVPDRGGRVDEHRAPPKETFAHQRGGSNFRGRGGGHHHQNRRGIGRRR